MGQEIERKWRVRKLPKDYKHFPCKLLEQAYLCQNPTLRIRKENSIFGGEEEDIDEDLGMVVVREEWT